jgi:hypothetical protein
MSDLYILKRLKNIKIRFLALIISFFSLPLLSQTVTITAPVASATFCAGAAVDVRYTLSPTTFSSANTFTAQLSDATGSFGSPTNLVVRTASTGATGTQHQCIIPYTTPTSSLYRIRVLSSAPTSTSQSNGVDLRINGLAMSTPTVPLSSYCVAEIFSVTFTQNCNFAAGNTYSVQLSDASGSFASPVTIGTRTNITAAAISCTVPSVPNGIGYRIRIVSSNPSLISADNGSDIIIGATVGNPAVFGSNMWNVYCYNIATYNADPALFNYSNYRGMYTESTLNTNSTNFWGTAVNPTAAPNYSGCPVTDERHIVNYKRQGFPCGYYQINIAGTDGSAGYDDAARLTIDGVVTWSTTGCCAAANNVWQGFLGPNTQVDFAWSENGGNSYGKLTFLPATINPIVMSAPATICSGSSTTLTATNTSSLSFSFSWNPSASVSPSTGSPVIASPTVSTNYTVTATDAVSTCTIANTVSITVNPLPATTTSISSSLTCLGLSSSTITASGANTYTWAPASGLNTTSGNVVVASPSVTTTYTVSGSNNCSVLTATRTVSVQIVPSAPSNTLAGNNVWNVYCYDGFSFNNYYGYYTENNLSFATSTRWPTNGSPSSANATTGLAYSGCTIGADQHSTIHRRTNFTCGYYQIDIPNHDDYINVFIDGAPVFQHLGAGDAHTNIWTGFLGANSIVEIRHQEGTSTSFVFANFIIIPYPVLNPPVTICAGTSATLTASPNITGATYTWANGATLSTTNGTVTVASPTTSTNYTCVVVDPVTTCSASATVSITVNPLPTTTVSPTAATISCPAQSCTLVAGGANTYSWTPSAGLSATTGNSVVATPTITTVYTVTGNNNCADVIATSTITVVPLVTPTVFPTGTWNVYCYNSTTFTNYYGYYTENGSGASTYDFSTATKYSSLTPIPSNANATNGQAYQGCTMPAINYSMSFKRTGFACGTYSIISNGNDDNMVLLIDGIQVAARASATTSITLWVGVLNVNSQVEFRLNQGTGSSVLRVAFNTAAVTPSLSTWIGGTSNDWFTASNWCGSGVPASGIDVLIPNSKPQNMPVINAAGAACRSLTISALSASTTVTSALPAASLTIVGSNSLDVYGNWVNNGVFDAGTGTVNILGATSTSITGTATESFYNLVVNKTGAVTVTIPAGVHQISNSMTLTNGIINQIIPATLRFLNNSTVSGASNSSYVNGQVIKVGTQAFTFPVGAGNFYRPISITAPLVATDHFTAQYYLTDASPSYTHTSLDATIHHIGRCEYWILNRTGGSSNVKVTLTWNTASCGVTNLSDLLVARWDAGQVKWKDEGNGGTTGNVTAGTIISSGLVTTFSPFTLASRNFNNPLPIELVSFNCSSINKNTNGLSWVTASESNNDYFAIERSTDGINFEQIAKQAGAGNSVTTLNYFFKDDNSLKGISYYRLKQVDFDGKFSYSEICSLTNNGDGNISFYPNPVKNTLTIDYDFSDKPKANIITVTDVMGKLVQVNYSFSDSKVSLDCSSLAEGIYFLKVIIGKKEMVNKFTIQK